MGTLWVFFLSLQNKIVLMFLRDKAEKHFYSAVIIVLTSYRKEREIVLGELFFKSFKVPWKVFNGFDLVIKISTSY